MSVAFGPGTIITLVSDGATPQSLQSLAGIRLLWPDSRVKPVLGAPDVLDFESFGIQIPGWLRENPENGGQLEWLMQEAIDPIVTALNAIPGPDGWQSEAARSLYQNVGGALLARGLSLVEARDILTQLYQSAVSNFVTAHPQSA